MDGLAASSMLGSKAEVGDGGGESGAPSEANSVDSVAGS